MFAHEFIRNALLAGVPVALACGAVGYFVVLRSQVFAGDMLSHVAFTGALAAAAAGLDLRVGLFAATVFVAALLAAIGERASTTSRSASSSSACSASACSSSTSSTRAPTPATARSRRARCSARSSA
jgi:ABC-type Mn2+/Zn2+ transport system permease subunit